MTDVALSPGPPDQTTGLSWQPTAAQKEQLAESFAVSQARIDERKRLANATRHQRWFVIGSLSVIAIAQAVGMLVMIPLQRQVPVPILIHDDGSTQIAWSWREVLPDNRAAVVTGALWYFVQSREGYNWADAERNYKAVTAMSAPEVWGPYQKWFYPSNPESPQVKVGRHGQITLQYDGSVLERDTPKARIYYWKTVQMDGSQPVKTHWTATLEYRVNEPVSVESRLFNPEGIFVTSYVARLDSPKQDSPK